MGQNGRGNLQVAAVTRVAVIVLGVGEPSPYGRMLSTWARDREETVLFTDDADATSDSYHYLRFAPMQRKQRFDLLLYDVDDTTAHAAAFPLIVKWPGILFCNDINLWRFTRAVSHEPRDVWGTNWIFNVAAPERAEMLVKLAKRDIEPGRALTTSPLAVALALRSAGVVVPLEEWERRITRTHRLPPVGVVEQTLSDDEFAAMIERSLPAWEERTTHMRGELAPIEHPFHDLYAVERGRAIERYEDGPEDQMNRAQEVLRELFDGVTNSVAAHGGENE